MKTLVQIYKVLLAIATALYTMILFLGADSIMENGGPLVFIAMSAIMFGAWYLVALTHRK